MHSPAPEGPVRLARLMAALSLATDLGLGQPPGHELGVCLSALELAGRLGCQPREAADVYYVALLTHVGCTAAAPYLAAWVGGDDIGFHVGLRAVDTPASAPVADLPYLVRRFAAGRAPRERARLLARMLAAGQGLFEEMAVNLCEGATLLARDLHMSPETVRALGEVTTRWDGKGVPDLAGPAISRPMRIVRVAHDLVVTAHAHGRRPAVGALRRRRGHGYDPEIVDAALDDPEALLRTANAPDAWEQVIDSEPHPVATVPRTHLASVARAFSAFADLKAGFLHGHSSRVAELAAAAAAARRSEDLQEGLRAVFEKRRPSFTGK